jgi:NAD(P)-dependent dehydrogenase (short-subunit alcohol dehydrogenase family)
MSPSSSASDPDRPLAGQAALVTGGTRNIGLRIAMRLRDAGADVTVCGRKEPSGLPPGLSFVATDVREPDRAAALIQQVVQAHGRLDLLVNNAGGGPSVPAADVSPNLAAAVIRLNLLGPFFLAQAANAVMQTQPGGGLIVNIGSVSASRPAPGTALYAAAKAGLRTLTQALALEWAPTVRVNSITVGVARTDDNAHHYGSEADLAAVAATVPMGRLATPDDVADACLLLTSPLAGYLTGADLLVDGGGQLPAYAITRAASPS